MKVFLSSTQITGSPSDSYFSIKLPWTRVPSALQTASLAASCCCAVAIMLATQARYIFPAKYRFRLIQQKLHQNRDVSRHTSPSPCPGSCVATYSVYSYTVIHLSTAYTLYIAIHHPSGRECIPEGKALSEVDPTIRTAPAWRAPDRHAQTLKIEIHPKKRQVCVTCE